jgi:thiol-disulfide isomerase/thioredoxin
MLSISLGPLIFTPQRLLFFIAFGVALVVGWLYGRGRQVTVEPILTKMLLWGIISARIAFVLIYLDDYRQELWRIIDIRDGGFLWAIGIAVAALVGCLHAWKHPPIRIALTLSIVSGLVVWGGGVLALQTVQNAKLSTSPLNLPLTTLNGQHQSLSHLRGSPMVVNLWATWCPPCRREMPVFAEAQQRESNIAFVFVNQGESTDEVASYLSKGQLELQNVYLDKAREWSLQLGASAMPTTLFFDEQGILVGAHTGELSAASLKHALNQYFNR